MKTPRHLRIALLGMVAFAAACGCDSHVKLEPRPVIFTPSRLDLCTLTVPAKRNTNAQVFYATNRKPKERDGKISYTNSVDQTLHLGVTNVKIGDDATTWTDICKASSGKDGNPSFRVATVSQIDDAAAFDAAIDRQLQSTPNREINIYVHGFKTYFEWEIEVLAKLSHFSGKGGAMICFAWPSRQSLMLYGPDVKRGRASAHYLADLIEQLAAHTQADHINVLAYSCGAAVATDALLDLRQRHQNESPDQLQRDLRIGNIIYAASDIDMKTFAHEQVERIKDLAQHVVIYISNNDAALGLASFGFGAERLGRPDVKKFTKKEQEQAAQDPELQIIDVSDVPGPHAIGGFGGHGYWYANDWIMTDLLVTFRWQIAPDQRGLYRKPGLARWFFPNDYPDRIVEALRKLAPPTTAPIAPQNAGDLRSATPAVSN